MTDATQIDVLIQRLRQDWPDGKLLNEAAAALTAERERADKAEAEVARLRGGPGYLLGYADGKAEAERARSVELFPKIMAHGDKIAAERDDLTRKLADAVEVVREFDRIMSFAEVWQPCGCFDEPDALQDAMRSARAFLQKQQEALT